MSEVVINPVGTAHIMFDGENDMGYVRLFFEDDGRVMWFESNRDMTLKLVCNCHRGDEKERLESLFEANIGVKQ